ncbi:MAG: hypothetical protein M1821_006656 [Bathelium mastoideum]|nr:MAG: hypothetical protein M1821_006656 [Bathelium mastoideum]
MDLIDSVEEKKHEVVQKLAASSLSTTIRSEELRGIKRELAEEAFPTEEIPEASTSKPFDELVRAIPKDSRVVQSVEKKLSPEEKDVLAKMGYEEAPSLSPSKDNEPKGSEFETAKPVIHEQSKNAEGSEANPSPPTLQLGPRVVQEKGSKRIQVATSKWQMNQEARVEEALSMSQDDTWFDTDVMKKVAEMKMPNKGDGARELRSVRRSLNICFERRSWLLENHIDRMSPELRETKFGWRRDVRDMQTLLRKLLVYRNREKRADADMHSETNKYFL